MRAALKILDGIDKVGLLGAVCHALGKGNRNPRGWKLLARILSFAPVRNAVVARALLTPYEHIGNPKNLYMQRLWSFNPYADGLQHGSASYGGKHPELPSGRIQHIRRPDVDRHLHNHPCNSRSVVLHGWYDEELFDGTVLRREAGSTRMIDHQDFHRIVRVSPGGCITLFITYEFYEQWGFAVNGRFVESREYLKPKLQEAA